MKYEVVPVYSMTADGVMEVWFHPFLSKVLDQC
jgi:hypothetical protein